MSLRPPNQYGSITSVESNLNALDYEVAGEKASSLGRAGALVEVRITRLNSFAGSKAERLPLVREAANAVYAYFIQRELCGLRRHDDAIRQYRIPREVLVRLGAKE